MKVSSSQGPGLARTGVMILAVVAAVAVVISVPSLQASAAVDQPDGASSARGLQPAAAPQKVEGIRQPSGLDVVEESSASVLKPTRIRSARPATGGVVAVAATAPVLGEGWQRARVSWYGPGFYGNTMAGGGTLQPDSMVVAHRSLPFGTRIEFAYNGRTCVAVVMDRGPYAGGRIFDLGPGTAGALGFSGVGTVDYRILN